MHADHPAPDDPSPPLVTTLAGLTGVMADRLGAPLLTLADALLQLGLFTPQALAALRAEDPQLLLSRSPELVTRVLLTDDELGRAQARSAGLPEVDALNFQLAPGVFGVLPMTAARYHTLLPLGLANETFFVASGQPTDTELMHHLAHLTGHTVELVWAPAADILQRLDFEDHAMPRRADGQTH